MTIIYQLTEIAATVIENILLISIVTACGGRKYKGLKHILLVLGFSGVMAVLVNYLNCISPFSYVTIIFGLLFVVAVTKVTSKGDWLLRLTACTLALFLLHSLDCIFFFSTGLFIEQSNNVFHSFDALMKPGISRVIYTLVNKSVQTLIFFLIRPLYSLLSLAGKKFLSTIFLITALAYTAMSVLLSMIMTESLIVMQVAIIISWIFIFICLIAVIVTMVFVSKYQREQQENTVIRLTNEMMEKNYSQLHANQELLSRQAHDFTNHLKTIGGMVEKGTGAYGYISGLLSEFCKQADLCHSVNDVIDAIINCKAEEASQKHISLKYTFNLPEKLSIAPIDISAILSNQIDNAIEACEKINIPDNRSIEVTIWQKQCFLLFKVANTVAENPFINNSGLLTSKIDEIGFHGLGIKNIKDTVEKYNGTLNNEYRNNRFISVALVQNTA